MALPSFRFFKQRGPQQPIYINIEMWEGGGVGLGLGLLLWSYVSSALRLCATFTGMHDHVHLSLFFIHDLTYVGDVATPRDASIACLLHQDPTNANKNAPYNQSSYEHGCRQQADDTHL